MHEDGFGATKSFACQAFAARTQRQRFAFNLLRVEFPDGVSSSRQVTAVDSGRIGVEVLQPKRLAQLLQLDQYCRRSTAKRLRQDHTREMINRLP